MDAAWVAQAHAADQIFARYVWVFIALTLFAWLAAAIGVAVFGISWHGRGKVQWGLFAAGFAMFAALILSSMLLAHVVKTAALREITPRLSAEIYGLEVNGRECRSAGALVAALRELNEDHPDHSLPLRTQYDVRLYSARGRLDLFLARDDKDPDNWWVFYPGFSDTTLNAIGNIASDAMDHC